MRLFLFFAALGMLAFAAAQEANGVTQHTQVDGDVIDGGDETFLAVPEQPSGPGQRPTERQTGRPPRDCIADYADKRCERTSDCCSENCVDGQCRRPGDLNDVGEGCRYDNDCYSDDCEDGTCAGDDATRCVNDNGCPDGYACCGAEWGAWQCVGGAVPGGAGPRCYCCRREGGEGPTGSPPRDCIPDHFGRRCERTSDCCSENCVNGQCREPGDLQQIGEGCRYDNDCYSDKCEDGTCERPDDDPGNDWDTGECIHDNNPHFSCNRNSDCCSENCVQRRCRPPGNLNDVGEGCQDNDDCHSDICRDGTCAATVCVNNNDCPDGYACCRPGFIPGGWQCNVGGPGPRCYCCRRGGEGRL
ncbi:unnamed protein product [Vitrella brassicaformis CCMP3155]|uniref:Disintegrin domain-containing protein n=1 Tax=Vitrella brassicaformis (strain CCMP3155) TaxID=1169540 RepID=A0A0G4H3K8_VITBC|nr:unnamed protein product [Vitrella brassicaformis CCMP3155]|eukprot:CEM38297.1 unnamed protein product [Vitrella brassicaformis CCMP3155]